MALAQLAAPFTSLKGKVQGTIYQDYRGATMVKSRISGGGRRSNRWDQTRAIMSANASSWKNRTAMEQAAWNSAAPSFPYIDKFGNPQTPSGYQLYCTLNYNRVFAGLAPFASPPAKGTEIGPSGLALAIPDPDTFNLTWTTPAVGGYAFHAFGSPLLSTGITQPPTRWRHLLQFASVSAQPVNVGPQWRQAFGYPTGVGQIWIKMVVLIAASGELYGETILNARV